MLNVTITYTRTDPEASYTPWTISAEFVNYVKANYEETGKKSVPAAVYHFADGHTEYVTSSTPNPQDGPWTTLVKTLTFQSQADYDSFHAEQIVQDAMTSEAAFLAPQGITIVRTTSGS